MRRSASLAPPRVRFELVPKAGGVRVLSRLDEALSEEYTSCVAAVAAHVERWLGDEVVANRVEAISTAPPDLSLRSWRHARLRLDRAIARWPVARVIAHADVARCYESIDPSVAAYALERLGAPFRDVRRCAAALGDLACEGVRGLPIGPAASAVIANAVLAAGDDALVAAGADLVRWVDDWWLAARSRTHAIELLEVLARALEPLGLRLHETKTCLLDPHERPGPASGPEYHRAAHAHAVPVLPRPHAVVSGDGRVGAGRRPARSAHRRR